MAVINCPNCKNKVSDKAKTCSHCNIDIAGVDQEQLHSIKVMSSVKKQQSLMSHSFIAMLLFCGGFLFLYLEDTHPGTWQYITAMTSTFLGFILYIVTRIRLILLKRK